MRSREFDRLVRTLNKRKAQIIHNVQESEKALEDAVNAEANDDGDIAALNADATIDCAIKEQQLDELAEIEDALSKAAGGTYGICEMCGEPIGIERMRIKPHARYCIVCREAFEKNRSRRR
ncbi:MAG: RNA polymerase-binding protein DksA [Helicobacteraceae bacterium]|jgi:DnaK suppressor protein|nr:RNA polymerase-binding protein DksA [Helicobacteraceae bacterium]